MATCKYCGSPISDKDRICPNCSAEVGETSLPPIPSAASDGTKSQNGNTPLLLPPTRKNNRLLLWLAIAAAVLITLLGAFFVLKRCTNPGATEWDIPGDTIAAEQVEEEDTIVHITPEFIEAVRKYDELGEFAERLAPVKRNGSWGFINVRGEEVIACQYDGATIFSEGKAAVKKNGEWAYINHSNEVVIPFFKAVKAEPFSEGRAFVLTREFDNRNWNATYMFIDEQGNRVFGGTIYEELQFGYPSHFPSFKNGRVTINEDPEASSVTHNLQGAVVETHNEDFQEEKGAYEYFSVSADDNLTEWFFGLKDASGKEVIPAKYHGFISKSDYTNYTDAPYGVVLAYFCSDNASDYYYDEGGYTSNRKHYGYVDLEGNDTFSADLIQRCNEARRKGIEKVEKEAARYAELKQQRNQLIGIWLLQTNYGPMCIAFDDYGKLKMYSPHTPVITQSYELNENGVVIIDGGKGRMYFSNGILTGNEGNQFTKISNDGNGVPQFSYGN